MKLDKNVMMAAIAVAALAGCNGKKDSDSTTSGALVDSAVQGAGFVTAGGVTGTTSADGAFSCRKGEAVTFRVGGTTVGQAPCAVTITPLELAGKTDPSDVAVVNRLVFLQALDDDDNPANGIRIASDVAAALTAALDFSASAGDFNTALAAALPAGKNDSFGKPYSARTIDANRRTAASEHFSGTLASLGYASATREVTDAAAGEVQVTTYSVQAAPSLYVPYPGSVASIKQDFPAGFFPAAGSGLAFKSRESDGSLTFYGITDRGPNGDSPKEVTNPTGVASKVFPAPDFTPSIATITVGKSGAVIQSLLPIRADAATRVNGRPLPVGSVGNSGEIPLTDEFKFDAAKVNFDANGLDSESLVYDAVGKVFWTSDEYGPFIVKIDAVTGVVLAKHQPGSNAGDLPPVLAQRRANRGMEGLAMDPAGKLHGFLQSPIDPLDGSGKSLESASDPRNLDLDADGKTSDKLKLKDFAQLNRWIEFDPVAGTSRLYAYPLTYPVTGQMWDRNRTGSVKLGDLVALGSNKFVVIEQGADMNGVVRNFLMLVEIPADVSNIAALGNELEKNSIDGSTASATPWASVVTLKKTLLLDLNAAGWLAEKAEGLTLVDGQTIALINDNDFGLRAILTDAAGQEVAGSPEDCKLDAATGALSNCPNAATGARVTRSLYKEGATRLWLIKFPKALSSYSTGP